MKRKNRLPDAINCDTETPFYQVPFSLIDDKNLSGKAFKILVMSLRNKEGEWTSYSSAITERMKEGAEAVSNGLKELEVGGYLQRVKYRDKQTKTIAGSVWLFTSTPFRFKMQKVSDLLENNGYEPQFEQQWSALETPIRENPVGETPIRENHPLTILNNNYIKETISVSSDLLKIKPIHFETFWTMYPKRTAGKGSRGKAEKIWISLCSKKTEAPPNWKDLKLALHKQKKSVQWQDPKYIPLPHTWLNQRRWQDDQEELDVTTDTPALPQMTGLEILKKAKIDKWEIKNCYTHVISLLSGIPNPDLETQIAQGIVGVRDWFAEKQERPSEEEMLQDEYDPEQKRWQKWQMIPGWQGFLEKYLTWLPEQDWLGNITPQVLQPSSKVMGIFIREYQKEIGYGLFTGRILN